MADFPESKQKRLMSLNQDVLAVSPAAAAEKAARPKQTSTGAQRAIHTPQQPAATARSGNGLIMALGLLASAGVIAGVLGIMFALDSKQQLQQLAAQIDRPDAQVSSLSARVTELEARLDAAGQETDKMDDQSQSSLLQINSRIRKTALDLTRLNSDVGKLTGRVSDSDASLGNLKTALSNQSAQLKALESKLAGLQGGPASKSATADEAAIERQLLQLNIRMEKQASEIKAIYRMLEAR